MPIQRITSGILADGAIVAADIADGIVTNAKLAGSITSDKITSVSNTAIAGLIQSAQIGSANASVINAGTLAGARLPAGSVLQVVQGTTPTSQDSTTSTSFVGSSLYASITPTSTSSKIFMIAQFCFDTVGTNNGVCAFYRDSTILTTSGITYPGNFYVNPISTRMLWGASMFYYDSPSSTSAIVYKVYFRSPTGAQVDIRNDLTSSQILLMEIAG